MESDLISIGVVLKPQGVSGEIKIKDEISDFDAVKRVASAFIGGEEFRVLGARYFGGALFFSLAGIADRNAAELLRGKEVFVRRDEIRLKRDEFFIADVIGCSLRLTSGKILGKIIEISTGGAADVYAVSTSEGTARFPMLKFLSPVYDIEGGTVTVDAAKFTEVVVYEN